MQINDLSISYRKILIVCGNGEKRGRERGKERKGSNKKKKKRLLPSK